MKFIIVLALFAVVAARPNKPDLPRPPVGDRLQIIKEKLAKIRDFILNRPVHIGAEPIDFDFDPTHPAVEAAPTPVSSPLVQIIVNVQGSDSGSVLSPVIVDGIEHPSPVEFVEEAEENEIYPTPVIVVEDAEDSHIVATPVVVVEDAEDSHIVATPVVVVEDAEDSHIEATPVIVVEDSIVAAPAIMAPEVLN